MEALPGEGADGGGAGGGPARWRPCLVEDVCREVDGA